MCAMLFLVPVGLVIILVGWGIFELNDRAPQSLVVAGPIMLIGLALVVLPIWLFKSEWDDYDRRLGK
jgi:hypothetical protein